MRLGERHHRKLSDLDVQDILEARKKGVTILSLAAKYSVDHSSIVYWLRKFNIKVENENYLEDRKVAKEVAVKAAFIKPKDYIYKKILAEQTKKCEHSKGARINGKCFICNSKSPFRDFPSRPADTEDKRDNILLY
jgi:hypothetical protein